MTSHSADSKKAVGTIASELISQQRSLDVRIGKWLSERLGRQRWGASVEAERQEVVDVLSICHPGQLTHGHLRRIRRYGLSVSRGLSYTAQMATDAEARALGARLPGWTLDNKTRAYRFVDELGVRRPASSPTTSFETLPIEPPCVVKHVNATGARGVYLDDNRGKIIHVRDGREFGNWEQVRRHAARATGQKSNRWFAEELIQESEGVPARDLKFFCAYGEVLLIQESRRTEGFEVCYWDVDGNRVWDTGKYPDKQFNGDGVTKSQLALAASISTEIPAPFMRIDMLKGADELVFGEFTPRTGRFNEFSSVWDRKLGAGLILAQHRIVEDLLAGKNFSAFAKAVA